MAELKSGDSIARWAAAIAAPSASPAGGAASAASAALAAAVVEMVARMTEARDRYAAVRGEMAAARARGSTLREELLRLAAEDAQAFAGFERALALPRSTEPERVVREDAKRAALREGARLQLAVLERSAELAELAATLGADGLGSAIGDSAAAGFLAAGAARSAYWAVRSNLQDGSAEPETRRWLTQGLELVERAEAAEWRVRQLLSERVR